ncbi:MAG: hypothetical protein M9887_06640 [Chitinophagales bacterium]|nr:hypothetical protein [Chitinophagales bacterium]
MNSFVKSVFDFFFGSNFPDLDVILILFPVFFLYVIGALRIALFFRERKNWQTAYTRKFFHFMIFTTAGIIQFFLHTQGVFILGWAVSLVILYILSKGDQTKFYPLLARPKDVPYESRYIVYPYLATFLGGVMTNFYFSSACVVAGYLVAGLGDAIGEPVGAKWGKTRYPVFNWWSPVKSYRSLEGSLAVLVVTFLAFFITVKLFDIQSNMILIFISALITTLIEAVSPHGWDNLTSQLAGASLMCLLLLG